ncbi:unnamed protein product [Adineta ricciae]|uniref:Endonuclease/exonuclease/phosphatase domain-containing protein n=1 Tax=Adineta ricciae TaxID=249248 RepID=A0A814RZD9_ADIRI|nr:unnamed protein product [Adineta ricciae]CAF1141040.1 unnamed protein product [Adineta ricciae]
MSDFKVVAYNIFEGGIDRCGSNRLNAIAAYLKSQNSTVVILTELNHFDSLQFSNFAKQWSHSYSVFLKASTGFHLGISSSFPLIELTQIKHEMHHGALLVHVNLDNQTKIGLVGTHLNPHSANARTMEAKLIADQLEKQDLKDWIIGGDLNSLSEFDSVYYQQIQKFTATDKLKAKFLTSDGNSIDYTTIQHFIQQGYIDTLQKSSTFQSSVPTKLDIDPMHALSMRLDYILATKSLTDKLTEANVLKNEQTEFLSDHYPVMASFRM